VFPELGQRGDNGSEDFMIGMHDKDELYKFMQKCETFILIKCCYLSTV